MIVKYVDTCTYVCVSGGKKCLFFGNLGVPCFLETPVLRFALLPYSRQSVMFCNNYHILLKVLIFLNDYWILQKIRHIL